MAADASGDVGVPEHGAGEAWYLCEEYKEMKAARFKAATTDVVLVEGV